MWMEDQKLMGNDPFLALVAKDNNLETLKEAVKAQEKLKLRSGLRMMTQKKNQVMMRRRTRTEKMKMELFYFYNLPFSCLDPH